MLNSYLFIYFHLIQKSVEQRDRTNRIFHPLVHSSNSHNTEPDSPPGDEKPIQVFQMAHSSTQLLELSSTASVVHILWKLESEAESGLHFSHSNMMFTVPNASSSTVLLCNPINFILLKKTDIYAKL